MDANDIPHGQHVSTPDAARPSTAKIWLLATRPKTLTAAAVPVVVGTALAHAAGKFAPAQALAALLVAFFIQIGTNFANDLFDFKKGADTEERLGPLRVTSAGLVTPRQITIACALAMSLAFLCGLFLVYSTSWLLLIVGIVSILSGLAYTGGPFPLAYNALGDLFVFIFFGLVATVGTYYVQTLSLDPAAFWYAVPVGALSTAILIVNNLRDVHTDKKHRKITTAVLLGPSVTRFFYLAMILLAYAIPVVMYLTEQGPALAMLALGSFPIAIIALKNVWTRQGAELNKVLAQTSILLLTTCLLMSLGLIL
tara:strand:+ start:104 stop:1036 length:933 start_codon:yes stop_codon:yes gene_type:complete